jgi:ketosteroid isomerase-like protein
MISCDQQKPEPIAVDEDAIKKEVLSVMNDYQNAILELNTEGVTKHYVKGERFTFYSQGKFMDYDGLVEGISTLFSTVTYDGEFFKDMKVKVLDKDAALAYSYLDYTITDTAGVAKKMAGAVTYTLVLDDGWKIIHGHGSYKAVDKTED